MPESYSRGTPRFKHFAFCLHPFSFAEGAMPVREAVKTEAIEQKTRFKTGWLAWSELVYIDSAI
jgi:hypothetical protein